MNHHGHAHGLRLFVHGGERAKAVAVSIRREQLVGRVNFEAANSEIPQPLHFRAGIGHKFRMHGAEREQSIGLRRAVVGDPIVYFGAKADDFRANVIDQSSALDASFIEKLQEFSRTRRIFLDVRVVLSAVLNQLQRARLEHIERLDVNVDIDYGLHDRRFLLERTVFFWIESENHATAR